MRYVKALLKLNFKQGIDFIDKEQTFFNDYRQGPSKGSKSKSILRVHTYIHGHPYYKQTFKKITNIKHKVFCF